jgi:hypothetical protein
MKTLGTSLAILLLSAAAALAGEHKHDISISFNSNDDPHVRLGARHAAGDARTAVKTRSGDALLLLTSDVVAVQLTDGALAAIEPKDDAGLLEQLVVAGVGVAVRKSVEYPLAHIRSAEVRNGVLVLTSDEGKPVLADMKVNGQLVTHDLSPADAAAFVSAFRAVKSRR